MRTHTSPVQARTMENAGQGPVKLFVLGKCIDEIQMMLHIVINLHKLKV